MTWYEIHIYAVAVGFSFQEVLMKIKGLPKYIKVKPFTCMGCLSGWVALGLGYYYYGYYGLWFVFTGLALGSLISGLLMKYF